MLIIRQVLAYANACVREAVTLKKGPVCALLHNSLINNNNIIIINIQNNNGLLLLVLIIIIIIDDSYNQCSVMLFVTSLNQRLWPPLPWAHLLQEGPKELGAKSSGWQLQAWGSEPRLQKPALGTGNFTSLVGKDPELVCEVEKFRLHIVGLRRRARALEPAFWRGVFGVLSGGTGEFSFWGRMPPAPYYWTSVLVTDCS